MLQIGSVCVLTLIFLGCESTENRSEIQPDPDSRVANDVSQVDGDTPAFDARPLIDAAASIDAVIRMDLDIPTDTGVPDQGFVGDAALMDEG